MKVGLLQLDGKIKNIALEKIKLFYEQRGDVVKYISIIESQNYDRVFCSSIFSFTDKNYVGKNWDCGGTGFNIKSKLPDEIENMKPKINIGFTTRGCIRNCKFCCVPEKEGKFRITGIIYDFWDGKSKDIILLDNNILASKKHFAVVCSQIYGESLRVDFNQGLDMRLLDNESVKWLKRIKHKEYRFAWDNIKDKKFVLKTITMLKNVGINRCTWYVLVGFNTTFEQDLYRVELLRKHNQNAYVQRYNFCKNKFYTNLAGWSNNHKFRNISFNTFLKYRNYTLQEILHI